MMKPQSASGSKPRINLINPHTGNFSPSHPEESEEFFHDISGSDNGDSDSDFLDLKPDPLTLMMGGHGGRVSPQIEDENDHDGDDNYQSAEPRRKGGRRRDPIWKDYHNIGGKIWQCNNCSCSFVRPQPDRMKKHRLKCQNLIGEGKTEGGSGGVVGVNNPSATGQSTSAGASTSCSNVPKTTGTSSSTDASSAIAGLSQFKTNSITRELKRIADALEESNKLKKLKLGLDPHIPFDGGSSSRK